MAVRTPVAFLVFNRPDLTARVFEEIRKARPATLLVIADGPRSAEEAERCAITRRVVDDIDWPCDVRCEFSATNLGCRQRVSSGLDWVFSQVEEAIILEDDCLPHPDFFRFCDDLIERYRHDARIGHIGGTDYNQGAARGPGSYYFTRYTSIWGWATWKRAWQNYDVNMQAWPEARQTSRHFEMFGTSREARHFESVWDDIHRGEIDTWDGQWLFACRRRGLLSIAPNGNLVSNLGCRADATHTVIREHPFAELTFRPCRFPLQEPDAFIPDDEADLVRASAEFLPGRGDHVRRKMASLRNKHLYGAVLRKIPIVGQWWASRRDALQTGTKGVGG